METPGTPITNRPLHIICNRCIANLKEDFSVANPCNANFGVFAKKCRRCANGKHECVAVEAPMFAQLNITMAARSAHATALMLDDEAQAERTLDAASHHTAKLLDQLKTFNRNRNKMVGDTKTPTRARAAPAAGVSSAMLLEVQRLRRAALAGVELGKLALQHLGVDTTSVDDILGPDSAFGLAPVARSDPEDEESEDEASPVPPPRGAQSRRGRGAPAKCKRPATRSQAPSKRPAREAVAPVGNLFWGSEEDFGPGEDEPGVDAFGLNDPEFQEALENLE
ncbi:hypothetical protein B0A55_11826 [Friedmanniomyces simplex]|uniref:Uncharacterized protein n=1 Tax=Friedmanniomyces simplex TaxID=329884 RepID=A0A4U0WXY3_9PEZI|nr:hypothetical protein B0A55_11826 [Friedmanniomyces simplex]